MDNIVERLANWMNSYPPLWMLYAFVLVLPFVLMACCFVKPKTKDDVGRRKKMDEPTPDSKPRETQREDVINRDKASETKQHHVVQTSPSGTSGSLRERSTRAEKETVVKEDPPSQEKELLEPMSASKSDEMKESRLEQPEEVNSSNVREEDIGSVVIVTNSKEPAISAPEEKEGLKTEDIGSVIIVSKENLEDGTAKGSKQLPKEIVVNDPSNEKEIEEDEKTHEFHFPPVLEDFDLMECEADPETLEDMFSDKRLKQIHLLLKDGDQIGLTIVGGSDSPNGNLPIFIKKVLNNGAAASEGSLSQGDQLVAVNNKLLIDCTQEYAVDVLRKAKGTARLLVLAD